jgi:hypothetical protein
MESVITLDEILRRWQRATERADVERVRVIEMGGEYFATSSSTPLRSYHLQRTDRGWGCECTANQHGLPCKHLAALADTLDLDVLADMRVDMPVDALPAFAA